MGGTGLGLAIATEDTRLHGGALTVWAEPDNGACFRLTLPLLRNQVLDPEQPNPLPMPPVEQHSESTARVTDTGSLQLTAPAVRPSEDRDTGQLLMDFSDADVAAGEPAATTDANASAQERTGSSASRHRDRTEES